MFTLLTRKIFFFHNYRHEKIRMIGVFRGGYRWGCGGDGVWGASRGTDEFPVSPEIFCFHGENSKIKK